MEEDIVPVVFRMERDGNSESCLALFPMEPATGYDVTCYAHIGQHSAANWGVVINQTRPAKPEEYAALKQELEGIGYRVKVYTRGAHLLHYRTRRIR